MNTMNAQSLTYYRARPIEFIETCLFDPETGRPFVLLPAERAFLEHAFKIGANGKLLYNEWVYSCPKKSGKTTFAALIIITMVLLFGGCFPEAFALANDQEQAQSRVFEFIKRIILASPLLRNEAQITQYKITFPAFGATIQAIASDAGSAAGANPVISCFDELWAYTTERSRRLFDEMVPPPTRKISVRLTVTYAGFSGESVLLEELYRRGKEQPLVGDSLHAGDGLLLAWHTKPVAPWQDEAWATSMRRERASAYQRQFLNEFASSSSQFVDLAKWDRCVDLTLGHMPANPTLPVWVGVDASYKHDQTAICVVTFDRSTQRARLVEHCVYQPTSDEPLDFELSIEAALLDLARCFRVRTILYDPWQMQSTSQRLIKAGLPMEEFPQSSPNLTAASQNLFDLIESQAIVLYPDAPMRTAVQRCVAIEGPRGWRIGKEKSAFKIDVVVALAMACYAAVQGAGKSTYTLDPFQDDFVDLDTRAPPSPPPPAPSSRLDQWYLRKPIYKTDCGSGDKLGQLYGAIDTAITWGKK
jgi:phage terminase large subunit-like protein